MLMSWKPGVTKRMSRAIVHLVPKEMGLLGIFLHRPNILHTRAYLWEALWGYESQSWEYVLVITVSGMTNLPSQLLM